MKHLSTIFALLLVLLSSNVIAQDTTYLGGFIHIRKSSKNVDKFANMDIMPNVNTIETKTIPDSLRKFNVIIGSSAYQLTDTSKWVVLDTAATLSMLLEFVITMQHTEKYHQRLLEKYEAASNILRVLDVKGYVRKKNMPEFIKARDYYIQLNQKP